MRQTVPSALAQDGARVTLRSPPAPRAGVAQSVERQPSKLNVAGSRPVSRSNPHFVRGTTLSLFAAVRAQAVGGCHNAQPRDQGRARSTSGELTVRMRDPDDHEAIYPSEVVRIARVER
jgi:hypothetical protein